MSSPPRAEGVQAFTSGVRACPLSSCISSGVVHSEKEACLNYAPTFPWFFILFTIIIIIMVIAVMGSEPFVHIGMVLSPHVH